MWFFKKKRETEQDILIKRIKEEQIDMQGLFSNISNRSDVGELYKELCKQCHPDRFENESEKKAIAIELFTCVQNNRNNYSKLIELKNKIEDRLIKS